MSIPIFSTRFITKSLGKWLNVILPFLSSCIDKPNTCAITLYCQSSVTLRQQVIDGVNATYRKLSQFAAEEFVDIWRKEVHEQMPLVTWQSKVDLANAIARGRKKSFKELQDEYNKFLEKRRGKPYKKDSERDWSKDKDKNNDLEF